MPYYVKDNKKIPQWIKRYIEQSRELYQLNKDFIDNWKSILIYKPNSWQKLEWHGERQEYNIWDHIIQFRASGVRVSKPINAPSLISMTPTQIPIIACEKRYMSIAEAKKLQSLDNLIYMPNNRTKSFKALGNAVNSHIVENIVQSMIA